MGIIRRAFAYPRDDENERYVSPNVANVVPKTPASPAVTPTIPATRGRGNPDAAPGNTWNQGDRYYDPVNSTVLGRVKAGEAQANSMMNQLGFGEFNPNGSFGQALANARNQIAAFRNGTNVSQIPASSIHPKSAYPDLIPDTNDNDIVQMGLGPMRRP